MTHHHAPIAHDPHPVLPSAAGHHGPAVPLHPIDCPLDGFGGYVGPVELHGVCDSLDVSGHERSGHQPGAHHDGIEERSTGHDPEAHDHSEPHHGDREPHTDPHHELGTEH